MLKSMRAVSAAVVLAALAASPATAQTYEFGSGQVSVDQVNPFTVYMSDLVGMSVCWTFVDQTGGCGAWANISGNTYGVQGSSGGNDFSLTANGNVDTYGALLIYPYVWNLQGYGVSGFSMDALSANFAFDIVKAPTTGTPGSSYGQPYGYCNATFIIFCLNTSDHWNTTVTYDNEVAINGDPNSPYGDEWGDLSVAFGDPFSCTKKVRSGRTYIDVPTDCSVNFSQDVDAITPGSGSPQSVVPEPGTMTLLATGLVSLAGAGMRRRKRRTA